MERNRIERAEVEPAERRLRIVWGDGHESRFHFIWLRHACFYPANGGQDPGDESLRLPDLPEDLAVTACEEDAEGVTLTWAPDGATTRHAADWLRDHCYSDAARAARKHRPVLWDGAGAAAEPWFDFAGLGDDDALYSLFRTVRDRGLARIRGVPTDPGSIAQVAAPFGPIHETLYGRIFDVRTESKFAIGATRPSFLGPHTDENYRHAPPGLTFFHCLEQSPAGGASILVDGFLAARRLAEADPEAFERLSRVPIRFVGDSQQNSLLWAEGKVICRDFDGDVVGIRFTDRTLPPLDLPEDEIEPLYRALRAFQAQLYAPDLTLRHRLRPGELHLFDNQRVLHGRSAFDPLAGPRHLQQCAVDRDEFHYRLRRLALSRGDPDAQLVMAGGALG